MGDIDGEGVVSGAGDRARVRVMCLVRCIGRIGLLLHSESGSDVTVIVILWFRIMVRCG